MFFFFNDTATTEIYTLSLHDALPISQQVVHPPVQGLATDRGVAGEGPLGGGVDPIFDRWGPEDLDRKSTRLNSSHGYISYAVFCLKKKTHSRDDRQDKMTRLSKRPLE